MKKVLIALLAMGVVSVANAEIYKIQKPTKVQQQQVQKLFQQGYGEGAEPFATKNKGVVWVSAFDAPTESMNIGSCYEMKGSQPFTSVKKVKCPANLKK